MPRTDVKRVSVGHATVGKLTVGDINNVENRLNEIASALQALETRIRALEVL